MKPLTDYATEVFSTLRPLGVPEQAQVAKNDKKSSLEFLAIRVPVLRDAIRKGFSFYSLSSTEILTIWDNIWCNSSYFEVKSAALMYYELQGAMVNSIIWPVLKTWSENIENWAHCDSLANIYSYLLAQHDTNVYLQLVSWNHTNEQWLRRLSLVSLVHYSGKKAAFLPPECVLPLITNCLDDKRIYVQKAIGWVLREMEYAYHDAISTYIEEHLPDLSRLALRTAITHYVPYTYQDILNRHTELLQSWKQTS